MNNHVLSFECTTNKFVANIELRMLEFIVIIVNKYCKVSFICFEVPHLCLMVHPGCHSEDIRFYSQYKNDKKNIVNDYKHRLIVVPQ